MHTNWCVLIEISRDAKFLGCDNLLVEQSVKLTLICLKLSDKYRLCYIKKPVQGCNTSCKLPTHQEGEIKYVCWHHVYRKECHSM